MFACDKYTLVSTAGDSGGDGESDADSDSSAEQFQLSAIPLNEDLYGVGIASLIRDSRKIAAAEGAFCLRLSRLVITLSMLVFTVIVQIFLILQMEQLVTAEDVSKIQKIYGRYEMAMYGNVRNHTFQAADGQPRGIKRYFNKSLITQLDPDLADHACRIPLSRPILCGCILFIWTLTVVSDLQELFRLSYHILLETPNVHHLEDMRCADMQHNQRMMIKGVTVPVKVLLCLSIFVPRGLLDMYLLWLGCCWLSACMDFSDLLMNAVGLEFILQLKTLFYLAVVPERDRIETTQTYMQRAYHEQASCSTYLGSFVWVLAAAVWVVLFMLAMQNVLPQYRWDVQAPCDLYFAALRH